MTGGEVQVVLLQPPDALSEEAGVKTCWKRCTAKQFGVGLGTLSCIGFCQWWYLKRIK